MSACPSTGGRGLGPGTGMSNRDFLSLGGGCQGVAETRQRHSWPSSPSSAPSPPAPLSRLCPYRRRPSQGLPPLLFPAFPGAPALAPEPVPILTPRLEGREAPLPRGQNGNRAESRNSSSQGASGDSVRFPPEERRWGVFPGRFRGQRGGGQG